MTVATDDTSDFWSVRTWELYVPSTYRCPLCADGANQKFFWDPVVCQAVCEPCNGHLFDFGLSGDEFSHSPIIEEARKRTGLDVQSLALACLKAREREWTMERRREVYLERIGESFRSKRIKSLIRPIDRLRRHMLSLDPGYPVEGREHLGDCPICGGSLETNWGEPVWTRILGRKICQDCKLRLDRTFEEHFSEPREGDITPALFPLVSDLSGHSYHQCRILHLEDELARLEEFMDSARYSEHLQDFAGQLGTSVEVEHGDYEKKRLLKKEEIRLNKENPTLAFEVWKLNRRIFRLHPLPIPEDFSPDGLFSDSQFRQNLHAQGWTWSDFHHASRDMKWRLAGVYFRREWLSVSRLGADLVTSLSVAGYPSDLVEPTVRVINDRPPVREV